MQSDIIVEEKAVVDHTEKYSDASVEEQQLGHDAQWEKKTMRKVDLRLVIILSACYAVSLIDRTNISVARVAGMQRDLRLDIGERYSIISLLFFVPYIVFELPSNIVLRKVGAKYWLSSIVTGFGAIMLGMGFVKTWQQLAVCRVLLGVLEAGFFPACAFLISTWYTRFETQKRMAVFYLTAMVVSGFSNIIGYGMSLLDGAHGLAGWRWIFIIFPKHGSGHHRFFLIVDFPDKSTFLTPEQKASGDALPDRLDFAAFKAHISDFKVWCFALLFMAATTGSVSVAYFLPVILSGQGYSQKLSLLLSAPPYVFAAIYTFVLAVFSDRAHMRAPFIALSATVCSVGLLITAYSGNTGARYFGSFLTIAGCQSNVPAVITYSQNNVLRHSKRSVTSALVIGFGGIGGIIASTVYRQVDFPRYIPGLWATISVQFMTLVILAILSLYFTKQNRKVDEVSADCKKELQRLA
ncbi:MFS general substrate transporter [Hymenopellis radicata]|nr:MFS general substrate transporter [Hymenopellis radicata]